MYVCLGSARTDNSTANLHKTAIPIPYQVLVNMNGLDLLHVQTQDVLRALTTGSHGTRTSKSIDWNSLRGVEGAVPVEVGMSAKEDLMEVPPSCELCGEEHIPPITAAYTMLLGQWMMNKTAGCPVFVLDPNLKMDVVRLENGQLALVFPAGQAGTSVSFVEATCLEQVMQWAPAMFVEDSMLEDK